MISLNTLFNQTFDENEQKELLKMQGNKKRTLKFLLPFIEKAKENEFMSKEILEFLKDKGFSLKETTFYTYLTKLKKVEKN